MYGELVYLVKLFPEFWYIFWICFEVQIERAFLFYLVHRNYRSLDRKYRVAVTTVATVAALSPCHAPARCSAPRVK